MSSYQNNFNVPLSLSVWLAHDSYDHDERENLISVTTLLKSIRQIVLTSRVKPEDKIPDISSLVPSRMGTSIHDGIENAWVKHYKPSLRNLGYPERVIENIIVNPKPEELTEDSIPVYLEVRSEKEIEGYIVSGKFDFVGEGRLEDFKSTGVFTYMNRTKNDDYILQGSIYRWLNPDIITEDTMSIEFIFTDWSAMRANIERDKGYPPKRTEELKLPLKTIKETEQWIVDKLKQIKVYEQAPDSEIPLCTDEQLWRKKPVFKYYKNPQKKSRATKNFDTHQEAIIRMAEDKGVGEIVEVKGKVGACNYCDAASICEQRKQLEANNEIG